MKTRLFSLIVFIFSFIAAKAQLEKIDNTDYYMSFEPVMGTLRGTSDFTTGVNPDLTLRSKGFLYGIDWVSARWGMVDGDILVPKVQCPIRIRSMKAGDNGLQTSDGTFFPLEAATDPEDKATPPFNYFDMSVDLYLSPYYFKAGPAVITPKFGLGMDLANHKYNIDLSKFQGKPGTNTAIDGKIAGSYSPYYYYSFWEDLYGINLGTYVNMGQRLMVDISWEYYPARFMTKMIGNTINTIWDANLNSYESVSSKHRRFSVKAQYRIISRMSVFMKLENSKYQFEGTTVLGTQPFYQKYSNLMFGITLGGPKM